MTAEERGEMIEMGSMNKIISGHKGKGGGGGYRAPVESPNTLQSIQYVTLTDVVSEGPIVGLYDNDKSIYLNETPLRTSGGSLTMQDVSWNIRLGTPDQKALPYDAGAETEVGVSAEVTNLYPKGEGPDSGRFQFSVTNETATRLRITMGVQALYETRLDQEHAGDMVPASVGYRIVIADGNGKTIKDYKDTLKGKTTSQYFWDRLFDLSGPPPVAGDRLQDHARQPKLCTEQRPVYLKLHRHCGLQLYLPQHGACVDYRFRRNIQRDSPQPYLPRQGFEGAGAEQLRPRDARLFRHLGRHVQVGVDGQSRLGALRPCHQ